ncbi:MAG: hypothetical protein IKW90_13675, partial [Lachnospiraceae bacterium]|nr:hypothetical protein [Lachnospiraceae bacterium]
DINGNDTTSRASFDYKGVKELEADTADSSSEETVINPEDIEYTISAAIRSVILSDDSETIDIFSFVNAEGFLKKYELSYAKEDSDDKKVVSSGTKETDKTLEGSGELLGRINTSDLEDGTYDVTLYVEDIYGRDVSCMTSLDFRKETDVESDTSESSSEETAHTGDGEKEFSLTLSHLRTSVGTEVTAYVTLASGMNPAGLKLYKDDELLSEREPESRFISEKTGRVTIKAVYTPDDPEKEELVLTTECTFFNGTDKTAPIGKIISPDFTDPIKAPVQIKGSATD